MLYEVIIMQKETKKQRFDRIAVSRKEKILDDLRLLENCSNRSNYEYVPEDIDSLFF